MWARGPFSPEVGGGLDVTTREPVDLGAETWRSTHLVAADVEPPGSRVQRQHLVDHGSHQRQRLRLVRVQGVGEKRHFSEVGESLMLQHKLRGGT